MHLFLPSAQSISREARHVQPFLTSKYDCSSVRQDVFNFLQSGQPVPREAGHVQPVLLREERYVRQCILSSPADYANKLYVGTTSE